MRRLALALCLLARCACAATFWVDNQSLAAADTNAGTAEAPWKTLAHAGSAKELQPGDTVRVRSGIYREQFAISVSGAPDKPITLAAAPGAWVVIKGSEVVRAPWSRLKGTPGLVEPWPNAFSEVWKVKLDESYFTDPRFTGSYADKAKRWVSQVFVDERPLQRIGDDPIYRNDEYGKLATVGRGLNDLTDDSFWFDPSDQTLYAKMSGEPGWFSIEVGVRGFALTADGVHDVAIRGFECRQNRQPGGQWPMASLGGCERVTVEDCRFAQADFCGFGLGRSKHCTIRRCEFVGNGDTGMGMGECEDCTVEDSRFLANNYRRFRSGWHAGGLKCIPANRRCTIQRCEAAGNIASDGIWFDSENSEIRIVGNVSHHNDGCGIFFEINKGGGVIADNLVYANGVRGIYISGSQKTWVVHNTVALNGAGIVAMPRGDDWPLEQVRVLNNLLIRNYRTSTQLARGCDLTLFMGANGPDDNPGPRTVTSNHSDGNVLANTSWAPTLRHSWNPDNTLAQWQARFGEDQHSRQMPIEFATSGQGFELRTVTGLAPTVELPAEVGWRASVARVGCERTRWPG